MLGAGVRAAHPDRAAFETLKRPARIHVSLGLLASGLADMADDFYETIPVLDNFADAVRA